MKPPEQVEIAFDFFADFAILFTLVPCWSPEKWRTDKMFKAIEVEALQGEARKTNAALKRILAKPSY
jgi:hypothetical protein